MPEQTRKMLDSDHKRQNALRQGPGGDVIPNENDVDARTGGGLPHEQVEDRPEVGQVTPEDYPENQRAGGENAVGELKPFGQGNRK